MGTFERYTDRSGEFRFRLKAANGEPILASEGYTSASGRNNGIDSVRTNAPLDERYERKQTPAGYSFTLKAGNHEVIGRSEVYTSASARDNGIDSVKRNAPGAGVVDK